MPTPDICDQIAEAIEHIARTLAEDAALIARVNASAPADQRAFEATAARISAAVARLY